MKLEAHVIKSIWAFRVSILYSLSWIYIINHIIINRAYINKNNLIN